MQEVVLGWKGQVQMKVGESTGTGSGGRPGDGVGSRQVYRKRRRQDGGGGENKDEWLTSGAKIKEYLMALVAMDGMAVAMF